MKNRLRRLLRLSERPLVAGPTPFDGSEKARNGRNEAAMSLVEDDTFGYLMLRLHKPPGSSEGQIEVQGHVLPAWWPAFRETMERIKDAGGEFYPTD